MERGQVRIYFKIINIVEATISQLKEEKLIYFRFLQQLTEREII